MQNLPTPLHIKFRGARRPRLYSVAYVSKKLGVSITTLRRWDRSGVLKPLRSAGGQRRYTAAQVNKFGKSENSARQRLSESVNQKTRLSDLSDIPTYRHSEPLKNRSTDFSSFLGLLQFALLGLLKESLRKTTRTASNVVLLPLFTFIDLTSHVSDGVFLTLEIAVEGADKGNKAIENTIVTSVSKSLHPVVLFSSSLTTHTKRARRVSSHAVNHAQNGFVNFGEFLDDILSLFTYMITAILDVLVNSINLLTLSGKVVFLYTKIPVYSLMKTQQ